MSFVRRTTFDPGPAPANYVAGLGRGASGFTTRSDIGEARTGAVMPGKPIPASQQDNDEHADYSESRFDKFSGYSENLFDGVEYDEADREADAVWERVDARMEERTAQARQKRQREDMEKLRKEKPKVQLEFADLTKNLKELSEDDWMSIPDIGDSHIRKTTRTETYVPAPDSLIMAAHSSSQLNQSVDVSGGGAASAVQDLTSVGKAQQIQFDATLSRASNSVAGQSVVNKAGYLTDLNANRAANEELVDLNKARALLSNVTATNPSHAPGWIAAARLEHIAGKVTAARKIILKGCQACPKNEDVWLEAARVHPPDQAKVILARAVQNVPTSVNLWLNAAQLEESQENKKRVLRKGLELIPKSVDLWKACIDLEEPDDARILLGKAVECVPQSVELWLALAHMEPYAKARKVLNKAREAVPTDPSIWITAARLEESQGNVEGANKIINRAVKNLSKSLIISRQKWLEEAYKAEVAGSPKTASAIIRETLGIGVEEADRKRLWLADAANALELGHVQCTKAVYQHLLSVFPTKKSIWRKYAELEKAHGTPEVVVQVLLDAVKQCPHSEVLWLFAAREMWKSLNNPSEAANILQEAFRHNPESELIWLAAVRLETDTGEFAKARALLQRARAKSGTSKVWIKSVKLERLLGAKDKERELLAEAVVVHPHCAKLWLLYAELERETKPSLDEARNMYQRALKNCPQSVNLWLSACSLEEDSGNVARARAMLDTARFKNPANPLIWKRAIEIEKRAGNNKIVETMLAKALQECPASGIIWALNLTMATKAQQRERCVDALKKCENDVHVRLAVAKVFWIDRKFDKVKVWLERACAINPKFGDAWAYLYKYTMEHEQQEAVALVVERCVKAEPKEGDYWRAISKSQEWRQRKDRPISELLSRVTASLPPLF